MQAPRGPAHREEGKSTLAGTGRATEIGRPPSPGTDLERAAARATEPFRRLVFEELFFLQLALALRRRTPRPVFAGLGLAAAYLALGGLLWLIVVLAVLAMGAVWRARAALVKAEMGADLLAAQPLLDARGAGRFAGSGGWR